MQNEKKAEQALQQKSDDLKEKYSLSIPLLKESGVEHEIASKLEWNETKHENDSYQKQEALNKPIFKVKKKSKSAKEILIKNISAHRNGDPFGRF